MKSGCALHGESQEQCSRSCQGGLTRPSKHAQQCLHSLAVLDDAIQECVRVERAGRSVPLSRHRRRAVATQS